jgi:hypothetical protein
MGVVEAAGIGQTSGSAVEILQVVTRVIGSTTSPPPRARGTASTSFGCTCLISGRGHLPGLVPGRTIDSGGTGANSCKGEGIAANSGELQIPTSMVNGWNLLWLLFGFAFDLMKSPSCGSWRRRGGAIPRARIEALPAVASTARTSRRCPPAFFFGQFLASCPVSPHSKQGLSPFSRLGWRHSAAEWPFRPQLMQLMSFLSRGGIVPLGINLAGPCSRVGL